MWSVANLKTKDVPISFYISPEPNVNHLILVDILPEIVIKCNLLLFVYIIQLPSVHFAHFTMECLFIFNIWEKIRQAFQLSFNGVSHMQFTDGISNGIVKLRK